MVLAGAILLPAVARGSTGFTFVPDTAQPSLPAGSALLEVAELTGNGIPDLVIADAEDDEVGVMLGNGAGGFDAPSWFPVAAHPSDIHVADFNNDGSPDLLVSLEPLVAPSNHGPEASMVQILFGNGHGGFTVGPAIDLPESGPDDVGDFMGNGNEDVVVAPNDCTAGGNSDKYYMLLGDGRGDLAPGPVYESQHVGGCYSFVGDFTGNGRDDIVTQAGGPGEEAAIVVLLGEPDGSFGPPIVTPTPQPAARGAFLAGTADLDGDGKLDLVLRSFGEPVGTVDVFKGNGAGGFSEVSAFPAEQPTFSFWLALGDFGGGSDADVVTTGAQQLSVLANNGAGVLSPAFSTPLETFQSSAFVADVNGDGRPDIILGPTPLQIFLNEPANPAVAQVVAPSVAQRLAPSLRDVRQSTSRWREGAGDLARVSRRKRIHRPPVGTTFSFSLNEQATVSLSFADSVAGRESGRECIAKNRRNHRLASCERTVDAGALTLAGHPGINKIAFEGRISRRTKLRPGSYTLTVSATNAEGVSAPTSLRFAIVK
jgi:hypothetical protein